MHRLEITGNTPEELYFNCIKTLSIMLKGSTAMPAEPVAEAIVVEETATETVAAEPVQEIIPPKKRGRPAKATEPVSEPAKTEELNDDISDLGGEPKKALTLDDDIKPRLQAISAACTKRGMTMPATVAYIQQLYAPFGIAKAPQLKPEQFEEFMEASEAYLDGTAEA